MRPQLLKVPKGLQDSFSIRRQVSPDVNNSWHYHPELELIYIKKGSGVQFVGDNIMPFKDGHMVLIGPNLPHYLKFIDQDNHPVEQSNIITVAHFKEGFWGEQFLALPENNAIKHILEQARRGLVISDISKEKVVAILDRLNEATGIHRIILLMEALAVIAQGMDTSPICSLGYNPNISESCADRLQEVLAFTHQNFHRKIALREIAGIAHMSHHSFCRFFKSQTGKTYSKFVIELRVAYACKLLIENHLCLKQLCFESGFNNFTSFHKYFKMITGLSPLLYKRAYFQQTRLCS